MGKSSRFLLSIAGCLANFKIVSKSAFVPRTKIQLTRCWALCLSLLLVSSPLFAGITNESNVAVKVDIARKDGPSQKITIYPGQSEVLPDDATQITVIPNALPRGDEIVNVKVLQDEGKSVYITKFGDSLVLWQKEEAEEVKPLLGYTKITSASNIALRLTLTKKSGTSETVEILPGQSKTFPDSVVELSVSTSGLPRGDEVVNLTLTLPNGEEKTISRVGERMRLDQPRSS